MATNAIEERALAKVNLTLEVAGRRPDGSHELSSLVAFADDAFDRLILVPADAVAVEIFGPYGSGIVGEDLVGRAIRLAGEALPDLKTASVRLEKLLPVAAGLGGGSADAAAALRGLATLNSLSDLEGAFGSLCLDLGADVPVCLGNAQDGPSGAFMSGIGEQVQRPQSPVRMLPADLYAVLVNPNVQVATGEVFRRLGAGPVSSEGMVTLPPGPFLSFAALLDFVRSSRNDLQAPALEIAPQIAAVLEVLARAPECALSRMSGSGATCFGLFATLAAAANAEAALQDRYPDWWVKATRLG